MDLWYCLLMAVGYLSNDEDFKDCENVADASREEVPCQDKRCGFVVFFDI